MSKGLARRASIVSCWVVLAACAAACRGPADHDSARPASSASNASVPNRWPLDHTADYKLELSTVTDTGQSPVAVLLTLSASLDVTFRRFESGSRAEVTLRNVQLLDHAKRPAEGAGQLARELEQPFGFELTSSGQLAAYYEAPDSSPYASGYRRQLAALFQLPPTGPGEAREWDATGLARVQYGASVAGKQTWKRLDYERVLLSQSRNDDALDAGKVKPQIVSSEGTTSVDAQGMSELHRREELDTLSLARKLLETSSPIRDPLIDALGMASTPECSTLLAELFFAPKSSRTLKIRAATALIRTPEPSEPGLAALERMIPDETFREHGLLGIGTYTRLFRQQPNAKLAERATSRLQQELAAAKTPRIRALVLLAIANSGASSLYDLAVAEEASKTPEVRHAAIQAIRLMDDARVEPRLAELLGATDESDVQSALQALGRRETATAALVTRVSDLARTHVVPMVRREAVLTLVKWREKWPAVEAVLKECAQDSDKRVREAAVGKAAPPTSSAP